MADTYQEVRDQRLELQRQTDKLKEREDELKATLLATLQEQGVGGVSGKRYRVEVKLTVVPVVTNWPEVYEYIKANDAFDILQTRLSAPAIRERQVDGEKIPGIGDLNQYNLSLRKL
jgi:hypothetical protein